MAFELKKAHGGVLSRYHAVERLKKAGSDDKHTEEGRWCQVQRRGWTYGSSKKVNIDFFFFCQKEINRLRGLRRVCFSSPLTRLSV